MAPVSVLLGSFGICTRDPGALLTITSSVSISLPSSWEGDVTSAGLSKEVKQGALWIARAGRCRLEVFHEPAEDESQDLPGEAYESVSEQLAHAVEECPLWADLGLNLARKHDQLSTPDSQRHVSFLVQHPDLNSELLSPEGIPCARFLDLSCIMSLQPKLNESNKRRRGPDKSELNVGCTTKRKRHTRDQITRIGRMSENALLHGHEPASQTAKYSSVNAAGPSERTTAMLAFDQEDVCKLMNCALYNLIGIKKQMVGVNLIGETPSPTLIEIAPAVWSMPYLEAMAARARFMPTITSVFGGLVDAESPRLRRKVVNLLDTNVSQVEQSTTGTNKEIRRRLEVLLRRNSSFAPLVKKQNARRKNKRNGTGAATFGENDVPRDEDIQDLDETQPGGDIHTLLGRGDNPSSDPLSVNQRSLEDVADDMNALHDEMAAILGSHPDEFPAYDTWQRSQYSEGEYRGLSVENTLDYDGSSQNMFDNPETPHLEESYCQNDLAYAHSGSYVYHDLHETESLTPRDVFNEHNDEEMQFFRQQDCLDDYRELGYFDDTLESSENAESTYASWGHYSSAGVNNDLTTSQPLGPENLATSLEGSFFGNESLCEDGLLQYEDFGY